MAGKPQRKGIKKDDKPHNKPVNLPFHPSLKSSQVKGLYKEAPEFFGLFKNPSLTRQPDTYVPFLHQANFNLDLLMESRTPMPLCMP
jgi:hypothetical protein